MRIIAHLDMDAFFASLEEANSPIFFGKPIVVGSDPMGGSGRGVVSTANYKAREYGIKSALPILIAWKLSEIAKSEGKPEVIFVQPDFEIYQKAHNDIYEIIKSHVDIIEPASIDEFYFDLSFCKSFEKAKKICEKIKKEIKDKLKVTCSIGLGHNKLISKIAAGINKPNGFLEVKEEDAEKFLESLNIRELPGVGPKTEELLNNKGFKIVKDLKIISVEDMYDMLGKWGKDLYYKIRAIDDAPLVENWEAKSIGEQATLQQNTLNFIYIGEVFENLCKGVYGRFLKSGFKTFKNIGITVRFSDFETKTSAKTLKKPTDSEKEFKFEAMKLLLPFVDSRKNKNKKYIRLIGVKIACLSKQKKLL